MKDNAARQSSGAVSGLAEAVEADRQTFSHSLDPQTRKQLGQFMTPAPVAHFMASLFSRDRQSIRLLDAGAGMGSLIAAYADTARDSSVGDISVVAVEADGLLAQRLRTTLDMCADRCRDIDVRFSSELVERDFIEYAIDMATRDGVLRESQLPQFDAAILNPPYAKIAAGSLHRRLLRQLGIEATNLYAAFVALAIKMLRPGGELVAIVPRSFCNGPYFRDFRQTLVRTMSLRRLHIYESRDATFRDDRILQENIVLHAVKHEWTAGTVHVTVSNSPQHIDVIEREVPYAHIVRPGDADAFIHIPGSADDDASTELVLRQPCNLAALNLAVSTGRVVDFRAREYLRATGDATTVPLIYPAHFDNGFVRWPIDDRKKPNAISLGSETAALVVPAGVYVLIKRFSSKEERRRVVATVCDPERITGSFTALAFENHLNYFHRNGAGLPLTLARGLASYLNSTPVDRYFRRFSGHTQVNATDLRSLRYPSIAELERIGARIGDAVADQAIVDAIVFG